MIIKFVIYALTIQNVVGMKKRMMNKMNREECLDWLYRLRSEIYVYMPKEWIIPMNNALDMVIKELEQEPSYNSVKTELDAINRQAAIGIIQNWLNFDTGYSWGEKNVMKCVITELGDLPSVSTEKTGQWIKKKSMIYCSECCDGFDVFTLNDPFKYCPNCGARMEVEE